HWRPSRHRPLPPPRDRMTERTIEIPTPCPRRVLMRVLNVPDRHFFRDRCYRHENLSKLLSSSSRFTTTPPLGVPLVLPVEFEGGLPGPACEGNAGGPAAVPPRAVLCTPSIRAPWIARRFCALSGLTGVSCARPAAREGERI